MLAIAEFPAVSIVPRLYLDSPGEEVRRHDGFPFSRHNLSKVDIFTEENLVITQLGYVFKMFLYNNPIG